MDPEEIRRQVMWEGRSEVPFSGEHLDQREFGDYRCTHCRVLLFEARYKFHSGCGWPSFLRGSSAVRVRPDPRVDQALEAVCGSCGGHLGHLFDEDHYCINSIALLFEPRPRPPIPDLPLDQHEPEDGVTAVHEAAERGQLDRLEFLWSRRNGATALERTDYLGRTPLACAAAQGQLDCLRFLLAAGARVDGHDRRGVTALLEAVRHDQLEAARVLLAWGADPDFTLGAPETPRELAQERGWTLKDPRTGRPEM